MKVTILRTPYKSPQCDAEVIKQPGWRQKIPLRCLRRSEYNLDGKNYCAFHGGIAALNYLARHASRVGQKETKP